MKTKDIIFTEEEIKDDMRYLQLLSQTYPTIADASTEIINLEAILNLPKPTEHFISDPHGESDAFNHVLRNASGYVKRKVGEIFGDTLTKKESNTRGRKSARPYPLSSTTSSRSCCTNRHETNRTRSMSTTAKSWRPSSKPTAPMRSS